MASLRQVAEFSTVPCFERHAYNSGCVIQGGVRQPLWPKVVRIRRSPRVALATGELGSVILQCSATVIIRFRHLRLFWTFRRSLRRFSQRRPKAPRLCYSHSCQDKNLFRLPPPVVHRASRFRPPCGHISASPSMIVSHRVRYPNEAALLAPLIQFQNHGQPSVTQYVDIFFLSPGLRYPALPTAPNMNNFAT